MQIKPSKHSMKLFAGNSQLQAPIQKSEQYDLFWDQYNEAGFDAAIRATVYDKVTKRFIKEYPMNWPLKTRQKGQN